MKRMLIIGGGQAGAQVASSLRSMGFAGNITMICDEAIFPYSRPPLSKLYLSGKINTTSLIYRPKSYFDELGVDVKISKEVKSIDGAARQVVLSSGETISYDRLALATGSRPRRLTIEGRDQEGIYYLRTVMDADRLRAALDGCRSMVIIGGGFIGMEVAATAIGLGIHPVVLEAAPRLMARAISPLVSEHFSQLHQANGVEVRTEAVVKSLPGKGGRVTGVLLANGETIAADVVIVGIGVEPETGLAELAGLDCNNGICIDATCQTSDPAIFSAGDCASMFDPATGRWARAETVSNALSQGRIAAAGMLGLTPPPLDVPWVWSDQFESRLQLAGICSSPDGVILRGRPDSGRFSLFLIKEGVAHAIEAVNRAEDFIAFRRMLQAGTKPTVSMLENDHIPLDAGMPSFRFELTGEQSRTCKVQDPPRGGLLRC